MMRRQGYTYRMLLSAVTHCLKKEDQLALLVFGQRQEVERCIRMLYDILQPINEFVEYAKEDRSFRFGNGSKLALRDTSYVEEGRWHGRKWTKVEEDNSIEYVRDGYWAMMHDLRKVEARNVQAKPRGRGRAKKSS